MSTVGRPRTRTRTFATVLAAAGTAALALTASACSPAGEAPATATSATPSASAPATTAPSPSPSPSAPAPSPSPSATVDPGGPVVSKPQGDPVTPEIFLWNVDEDAGQLQVVVEVPDIFEDGGTCAVTVTSGSTTITKERAGEADRTSTACGQFVFALSQLPGSTAVIVASYESAKHVGESESLEVSLS